MTTNVPVQQARSITEFNTVDKAALALVMGEIQGTIIADTLSGRLKNTNYLPGGEPVRGGTVKVRRFRTSASKAMGTARAAAAGDKIVDDPVYVNLDTDREFSEEIAWKDLQLYGNLLGFLQNRKGDYAKAMEVELEDAYFLALQTAANTVDVSAAGSAPQDRLLALVQYVETLRNNHVKQINRRDMIVTLAPKFADLLLNYTSTLPNPLGGGQDARLFHEVKIYSAPFQTVDVVLQYVGAVAQPIVMGTPKAFTPEFSDDEATYMPYTYGTKVLMPDLVFKAALSADNNISI